MDCVCFTTTAGVCIGSAAVFVSSFVNPAWQISRRNATNRILKLLAAARKQALQRKENYERQLEVLQATIAEFDKTQLDVLEEELHDACDTAHLTSQRKDFDNAQQTVLDEESSSSSSVVDSEAESDNELATSSSPTKFSIHTPRDSDVDDVSNANGGGSIVEPVKTRQKNVSHVSVPPLHLKGKQERRACESKEYCKSHKSAIAKAEHKAALEKERVRSEQLEGHVKTLTSHNGCLNGQLRDLHRQTHSKDVRIHELEYQGSQEREKKEMLTKENDILKKQVQDLQNAINEKESRIYELEDRVRFSDGLVREFMKPLEPEYSPEPADAVPHRARTPRKPHVISTSNLPVMSNVQPSTVATPRHVSPFIPRDNAGKENNEETLKGSAKPGAPSSSRVRLSVANARKRQISSERS